MTTRDKQVLKNCMVDQIYEIEELPSNDAFKLFCRHAFRQNPPKLEYEKLSYMVVNYLGGIPLALKVLGSSLFDKSKEVWESTINKLEKILDGGIYKLLKISYDGLNDNQQKIFLDIACFLKGTHIDLVKQFLNACGFFTDVEISGLIDKSLIVISRCNTLTMHDLLQAMGREIVRQQSIEDLGQRTRLWHHEDIYHVLTKNMGSTAIQGISLNMSKIKDINLNPCAFANMQNIRFLEFYCSEYSRMENKVHVSEGLDFVLNELRYLQWCGFPFKSLQSNFYPKHLVVLSMPDSNIKQLWDGVLQLVNLKEIDLSGSEHLISCPDLSGARNLEKIYLDRCTSLIEIPLSIQYLSKLDTLYLCECKSLRGLPDCFTSLKSLKSLNMFGCSCLKMLPELSCNIEYLNLSETAIEELSPAIDNLSKLVELNLHKCCGLKSLPSSIGTLESLKRLDIAGTSIREVPPSIVRLSNLESLSYKSCKHQDMMNLLMPALLRLCGLKDLDLTDCGITEIPDSLGYLSCLQRLHLGRNNFASIPTSIINLFNLEYLDISFCQRLLFLPELPSTSIHAVDCFFLAVVPFLSVPSQASSFYVSFMNCYNLYQNGLKGIVDDFAQKLLSLATLWTKQPYLKHVEYLPAARLCFPGSEVPEWFSFRNTGSLITTKLPPGWNHNNFVGFALCAVMDFQHHPIQNYWPGCVWCECNLKSKDGHWHSFSGNFGYQPFHSSESQYVESYHVYMGSDHLMYPRDIGDLCYDNEVTFQFRFGNPVLGVEISKVESCGVHLMYAQHLGKSNGSFDFGEKKDEPHPKRLKRFELL